MLYDPGALTEEQAEQVIGEKMMARINALNHWCQENGFILELHSTFYGTEEPIFKNGLYFFRTDEEHDSKAEILEDTNVPEKDLEYLENWVKNHPGYAGKLSKSYESYRNTAATVTGYPQLSAKTLLEYNHRGGDITIILCVPSIKEYKIGKERTDRFTFGTSRNFDPHVRRTIICKQTSSGEVVFESEYFYPTQSVLCAFDRGNIKIKFNKEYDETFYLDSRTPQTGSIKKGDLVKQLREAEQNLLPDNNQSPNR